MKHVVKDTLSIAAFIAVTGAFIALHSWSYVV